MKTNNTFPKLESDWEGLRVRFNRSYQSIYSYIPGGTVGTIRWIRKGRVNVRTDICGACGVRVYVTLTDDERKWYLIPHPEKKNNGRWKRMNKAVQYRALPRSQPSTGKKSPYNIVRNVWWWMARSGRQGEE